MMAVSISTTVAVVRTNEDELDIVGIERAEVGNIKLKSALDSPNSSFDIGDVTP